MEKITLPKFENTAFTRLTYSLVLMLFVSHFSFAGIPSFFEGNVEDNSIPTIGTT
ncbi:hypothetical protein LCGC14_2113530, partial [marine sediment metagenome]